MMMNRRSALITGAAALANGVSSAADQPTPAQPQSGGFETIPLWPAAPPGGDEAWSRLRARGERMLAMDDHALMSIADPQLRAVRPLKPDGSALLIIPGGGYLRENIEGEGTAVAHRFADAGITAFALLYRLPGEGWSNRADVPLVDAQRALRLIRSNARSYAIDPARIGVLGFSAGGHLAASLATRADAHLYAQTDDADRADAHPNFFAVGYPVVTMLKPFAHEASREHLFGSEVGDAVRAAYSCERLVTDATPPAFLFAAADDPDVPVENTLMLHASLRAHRVGTELHVFERGGHSFALGSGNSPVSAWPDLFLRWGRNEGYFRG